MRVERPCVLCALPAERELRIGSRVVAVCGDFCEAATGRARGGVR